MNFSNYATNSFDKKMLLLFKKNIQLYGKTVDEMTYTDLRENIDIMQKKLYTLATYMSFLRNTNTLSSY